MKKKFNVMPAGSIRRWVKRLCTGLMKRQQFDCQKEHTSIAVALREIQESIDLMAREIARQSRCSKR
jgi:hypothetical protein